MLVINKSSRIRDFVTFAFREILAGFHQNIISYDLAKVLTAQQIALITVAITQAWYAGFDCAEHKWKHDLKSVGIDPEAVYFDYVKRDGTIISLSLLEEIEVKENENDGTKTYTLNFTTEPDYDY